MRPLVVPTDGGELLSGPVGGPSYIKIRGEDTGGAFTLIENHIPPKQGSAFHLHNRENEMWYIAEGHFRFRIGEELHDAPQGTFVFVPLGTPHCLQNIGDSTGRVLVMFTPAGMERFFDLIAQLPSGDIDLRTFGEVAARCAMDVVGPPLAEMNPLSG
ncbi:MAG: cupin domain-containing protein [Actinomycetota bacterium]